MLVPVRTSIDMCRCNDKNNELYQLKVDGGYVKHHEDLLSWRFER